MSNLFGKRSGDSLFGNPASKANPPLFGQSSNQTSGFLAVPDQNASSPPIAAPSTSVSVFGSPAASQSQRPSLQTTSLFGNNNNQQGATSSLFGNNQSNNNQFPAPTGSLFGNANNNNNQPTTGSLFGNTPNNNNQQSTGSLFGNANNNTQQPTPSLFGNTNSNNQQQTPSLFGSANNSNQQQPSSSLFGNTNTHNNSLFGNTNNNTNSLFGNKNTNNNQQPSNSLFGSTPNPINNNNSLFGNTNNNSLLKPTNNSLFSTNNNSIFGASQSLTLSGSTNSNLLASTTNRRNAQVEESIESRILKIYNAWNLTHPNCAFQYFFYNLVEPEHIDRYARPALATDENKWQKAKRLNPDPNRMVPSLAIGFEDLGKRLQAQRGMAKVHVEKLQEVEGRASEVGHKLSLTTTPKLHRLINAQTILATRLIRLVSRLPSHIEDDPKDTEEAAEELVRRTGALRDRLRACGGRARVGELWAGVRMGVGTAGMGGGGRGDDMEVGKWSVADEREIKKVLEILVSQQRGIDHLRSVLENARSEIRVMAQAFEIKNV